MLRVSREQAEPRLHGELISVDPSVRSPGVARFVHGALVSCTRLLMPDDVNGLPWPVRVQRVAMELWAWYLDQEQRAVLTTIVWEKPQVYRGAKLEGDPNDLLGLVGVGAAFTAIAYGHAVGTGARPPEIVAPEPDEWAGQLKKTKKGDARKSPRGQRVVERLQPGELRLLSGQHDEMDGVAIGLWALGRFNPLRVFAGAKKSDS